MQLCALVFVEIVDVIDGRHEEPGHFEAFSVWLTAI